LSAEKGKKADPVDLSQEVVAAGWARVSLPGGRDDSNSDKKDNRSE